MNTEVANETKPDKTQLFYDALAAYVSAKKVGQEWPALPLRKDSHIGRKYVKLRTGRFIIAKYDFIKKELTTI